MNITPDGKLTAEGIKAINDTFARNDALVKENTELKAVVEVTYAKILAKLDAIEAAIKKTK